ncbi:unnamed protein product [Periconia digitata]|uniref:Cytochrome P450 n=1 Tax=Periconia digitata TaxID=1303443 RepID=A0A9W4XN59_9PLEO|nr:unnamed protein product [Periconia digitata]
MHNTSSALYLGPSPSDAIKTQMAPSLFHLDVREVARAVAMSLPDLQSLALILVFLITVFWLRFRHKHRTFLAHSKRDGIKIIPPTFPYAFPLLGSLPVAYLWKPKAVVLDEVHFFQSAHPARVKTLMGEFYVIKGPEHVKSLFKNSVLCTSIPFVKFALGYAFGLPKNASDLYDKDSSGTSHVPISSNSVEPRNRVDYLTHRAISQFLEGKGLSPLYKRYIKYATNQLYDLYNRLGTNWTSYDDLMENVGAEVTVATFNAFCGPHLLRLNPIFPRDFWNFDRNLQTYLQGIPQIFAPRAYAARKRVIEAIRTWQQHARENFDPSAMDENGDDPFWGSSFFRKSHDMFLAMDGFDHTAVASTHLGAIWASRNSVATTSWCVFNVFRDPDLLNRVRAELDPCAIEGQDGRVHFDIDKLLHLPVLQAVYAETLRLIMHFYIIRTSDRSDMDIDDWIIPKHKVAVTPTTVAHMNAKAWNAGVKNEHPVEKFWIGRFLEYPEEESSPKFSTANLEGSWIPYGGGPRICPGRNFAKRHILLKVALMVTLFDCEISPEGIDLQEDSSLMGFGGGVSNPSGKAPMKLRRRV